MIRLALSSLKYRLTSFVATFLALFLGAAIVMACGGLMETGIRAAVAPERLGGAAVVVTGNQTHDGVALTERTRIDSSIVDQVAQVPGVATAIADLSLPAAVLSDGSPVSGSNDNAGHNWSSAQLTPFTLSDGVEPTSDSDVVLSRQLADSAGVSTGDSVDVAVRGATEQFTVVGIVDAGDSSPAVFFSDSAATDLAGTNGRIDSVGVLTEPGADTAAVATEIGTAVGSAATVLTGENRGLAEFPGALASQQTLTILAGIFGSWALLIALFGVASMLSLSLGQRQREMALLRAIGSTPRQVRRMILGETILLCVVATALAVIPGYFLGRFLFGQLASSGIVSSAMTFHQGLVPVIVGIVTAMAAAIAATLVAGRRAANTKPLAALSEATEPTRWLTRPRLILAVMFLAAGISMSVVTVAVMENGPILASTAGPASVLVGIGLALLTPGFMKVIVAVVGWPVRMLTGSAGFLAVNNARARSIRMAGAVAPIVLLVGIAVGTLYMQSTENAVKTETYATNLLADYVISTGDESEGSVTGGFAPGVVEEISALPGVAGASELVTSDGFVDGPGGGSDFGFRGVTAAGAQDTIRFESITGSIDDLTGDSVAISESQATSFGVQVGDTLGLHLGDGSPLTATVVSIHADDLNDPSILLPADVLAAHTTSGLAPQILVRAEEGVDESTLRSELDSAAALVPGASVSDRASLISDNTRVQQILVSANYTIVAMIIGYAAITVVNTLVAATRKRGREFGLQRLTGSTRRQVLGMLGVESGFIVGTAVVLGTVAAAATMVPYSLVKSGSAMPSGSPMIYIGIVVLAIALTIGSTMVPAWRGMARPAVDSVTRPD
ncbi:FtsX-like permease family protein [Rhodococcus sp. 14-2470-1a]|uniref:FtsX-like permease family protein n=1 Tax=Rhodococcus sp. 14-2470-1a TaxID=2023150 RepID=UPI000B9C5A2C|nr:MULTISPECIES: FtsX-like permease family protein [unclassified Rhodococcus (in: high G+C Gram-positive bacteria)]OZD59827.1 ABC transporter permease [Rhodococcus sp. 06-1059B-a]OZF56636.1 ABC transporter permease [Rhodococcus sp. 14-2470-1a]